MKPKRKIVTTQIEPTKIISAEKVSFINNFCQLIIIGERGFKKINILNFWSIMLSG